jgi:predicted MPP superfamily phosphohydrolase
VLAVLGNADGRRPVAREVLEAAGARVLANDGADVSPSVTVWGIGWLDRPGLEEAAERMDRSRYNICLTHAPGLIPDAARAGFDLYLCGHTHGGQVRLPGFGAVITLGVYGKRFECGRYELDGMTAYVTRGLGLEGGLASRVRLLCPPEAVVVDLGGRADHNR